MMGETIIVIARLPHLLVAAGAMDMLTLNVCPPPGEQWLVLRRDGRVRPVGGGSARGREAGVDDAVPVAKAGCTLVRVNALAPDCCLCADEIMAKEAMSGWRRVCLRRVGSCFRGTECLTRCTGGEERARSCLAHVFVNNCGAVDRLSATCRSSNNIACTQCTSAQPVLGARARSPYLVHEELWLPVDCCAGPIEAPLSPIIPSFPTRPPRSPPSLLPREPCFTGRHGRRQTPRRRTRLPT